MVEIGFAIVEIGGTEFATAEFATAELKVSKSQKQILKFSFEPKNEQKYFCISAVASKMD